MAHLPVSCLFFAPCLNSFQEETPQAKETIYWRK